MRSAADARGGLAVRVVAIAVGTAWTATLFWAGFGPRPHPDTVIAPVESYDSDDLRRAADALEDLRDSRLTPDERSAVGIAADALEDLASGDATLAPATTVPAPTSTAAPRTTTTTTTTTPPPATTAPTAVQPGVAGFLHAAADQLGVPLPDEPADEGQ